MVNIRMQEFNNTRYNFPTIITNLYIACKPQNSESFIIGPGLDVSYETKFQLDIDFYYPPLCPYTPPNLNNLYFAH